MIKIFHTADVHLGVENYGKIDSKTGIHTRLLDFKNSFAQVVTDAIEQDIDLFLFCGDAYKTAYPTPTQLKFFMEELFRLQQAKIPVVIIVGNHDHPLSFGKANALDIFADLPLDGFYLFSKPEIKVVETKSGKIQIVGMPWPTKNNLVTKDDHRFKNSEDITRYLSEKVSQIIQGFVEQLDSSIPSVLAGHLTVGEGIFSGSEKRAIYGSDPTFLVSELANVAFDYVALGHLHRFQNLNEGGYPAVVYSGSGDRGEFGESKDQKGYCKILIDETAPKCSEKRAVLDFVPIQTRPFVQIELEIKDGIDQTDQILAEITNNEIDGAIVKIVYHVFENQIDKVDLNAILRACGNAHYLVGVFPVRRFVKLERRAALKVDMDFESLISKYLESKEESKETKDRIMEKAKILYTEYTDLVG